MDVRPSKRRRVDAGIMQPDGFSKSVQNAPPPPIAIPAFTSAFYPSSKRSRAKPSLPAVPMLTTTTDLKPGQPPKGKAATRVSCQLPTNTSMQKELKADSTKIPPRHPSTSTPILQTPRHQTVRPAPAPPAPPPSDRSSPQKSTSMRTIGSLIPDSRDVARSPVKRAPIPPPVLPSSARSGSAPPLKKLVKPPSLPAPVASTSTRISMKPVSTTAIAQRVNPMSESGPTELLAIALSARPEDEVVWVSREERELRRGLVISPEKIKKARDGGTSGKFVTGGLADRASRLLASSRTSQSLWETGLAKTFSKSASTTATPPDVRLRVLTVVATAAPPSSTAPASIHPRTTLALCAVLSSTLPRYKPKPRIVIPFGTPDDTETEELKEVLILFRDDSGGGGYSGLPKNAKEGDEAWVWRPWMSIGTLGEMGDTLVGQRRQAEGVKSNLLDEVLFCTRYTIRKVPE